MAATPNKSASDPQAEVPAGSIKDGDQRGPVVGDNDQVAFEGAELDAVVGDLGPAADWGGHSQRVGARRWSPVAVSAAASFEMEPAMKARSEPAFTRVDGLVDAFMADRFGDAITP